MIELLRKNDFAAGLVFGVIGVAGAAWSLGYPIGSARQMGPGYFPAIVFGVLSLLGFALVLKAVVAGSGEAIERLVWRPFLLIPAALLLFALAVERAGFVLACTGLVLVSTTAGNSLTMSQRLLLCAAVTAFSWLIFVRGLGLLIPTWPELPR